MLQGNLANLHHKTLVGRTPRLLQLRLKRKYSVALERVVRIFRSSRNKNRCTKPKRDNRFHYGTVGNVTSYAELVALDIFLALY